LLDQRYSKYSRASLNDGYTFTEMCCYFYHQWECNKAQWHHVVCLCGSCHGAECEERFGPFQWECRVLEASALVINREVQGFRVGGAAVRILQFVSCSELGRKVNWCW
jgi:hypothetical protein